MTIYIGVQTITYRIEADSADEALDMMRDPDNYETISVRDMDHDVEEEY